MAGGGTSVSGRRKVTIPFAIYADMSVQAGLLLKRYLMGADDDVGYTFDTPCRITRLSWQTTIMVTDATETFAINVCKGTEATVVYTSGNIDAAAAANTVASGTDTSAATEALSQFTTADDLIIVAEWSAGSDTSEAIICAQIDVEFED